MINDQIIAESLSVTNPGAALDPEAPNFPNTTVLKKAKHELVVGGLSAGALSTRMALLLIEFQHKSNPCSSLNKHHRTKNMGGNRL